MAVTELTHLGTKGEGLVAGYLEGQGYTILERNYRVRLGEVDIIALKDNVIAFVEVKVRRYHYFSLSEVITPTKRQRIVQASLWYVETQRCYDEYVYRFDVALLEQKGSDFSIDYIPNAFQSGGESW